MPIRITVLTGTLTNNGKVETPTSGSFLVTNPLIEKPCRLGTAAADLGITFTLDEDVSPMRENDLYAQGINGEDVDISTVDYDPGNYFTLYVGTGGDVAVEYPGGGTVTYKNVSDGQEISDIFVKVVKVGTTAADMIARTA